MFNKRFGTDMIKRRRVEAVKPDRPAFVEPMMAKLARSLPEGPEWGYEVKFDGYRIQALKHGAEVQLLSRRGHSFTKRFARIAKMVSTINAHSTVIDGEVVAIDEHGL